MPIAITYSESSFLMPALPNWQDVHSQVYQLAMNGEDRQGERNFIYSVETDSHLLGNHALVTVRSVEDLPDATQPAVMTLNTELGSTLRLSIILCRLTSIGGANKEKKQTMIQHAPYDEWFTKTMSRAGLHVEAFTFSNLDLRVARKQQALIRLPGARFNFTANITDIELFKNAWTNGIGAKRGYGFGMLEIIADA